VAQNKTVCFIKR